MDNKLSELSKPVAWAHRPEINAPIDVTENEYVARNWRDVHERNVQPLYSQEYVSALDKVAQFWIGESAGWKKRTEDAEKRIAELEEEFAFIMGQNDGMEKELRDKDARIEHLEAKLATPVQLPKPCAFNLCDLVDRDAVIASLREQGLTVEGDE